MASHVALLRAINVAGNSMVAMSDLRRLLEGLGLEDVRSILQSGNLVFRGGRRTGSSLEAFLESEARKALGVQADFIVRTPLEWAAVVARNPFPDEAKRDPAHLSVVFLRDAPSAKAVEALRVAIRGREVIQGDDRHLYAVYPDGMGRSKLTHALIEGKLATRGTARNWNTVLKLAQLVQAAPAPRRG
jgi:uncharacterized protein (DUF1697 family)